MPRLAGGLDTGISPLEIPSAGTTVDQCVICGLARNPLDPTSHGMIHGNTTEFLQQRFPLWKCPRCETIHSLTRVQMDKIYQNYPLNRLQKLDYFARGRFHNLLRRLKNAGLRQDHRILDMGCGNGAFVTYLRSKGYRFTSGYDPYVKEFECLDRSLRFDFVIANDVIEHVDDPRAFLIECSALLDDDGTLYVGTADAGGVEMNKLEKHILLLHQPFHRSILTQGTLTKLAGETPHLELLKSYRRSYMDTFRPFVNYRFLDEFNAALGYEMDLAFKPVPATLFLRHPRLFVFGLLGFFFPSAAEPAVVLTKRSVLPAQKGEIRTTIIIDAPVERAWNELTDFEKYKEWSPFMKSVDGHLAQGAKIQVHAAPEGGLAMKVAATITDLRENQCLQWTGHFVHPRFLQGIHTFRFERLGVDKTRFVHSEVFSGVFANLMLLFPDKTRAVYESFNRAFKARVESNASVSQ